MCETCSSTATANQRPAGLHFVLLCKMFFSLCDVTLMHSTHCFHLETRVRLGFPYQSFIDPYHALTIKQQQRMHFDFNMWYEIRNPSVVL